MEEDPQIVSQCTGENGMSDKKKEVRWFSIMDYEKKADYLSKRH